MGHDHSYHGIERQGQRSRLLALESQFEKRAVRPRSSIEDSFLVCLLIMVSAVYSHFAVISNDGMIRVWHISQRLKASLSFVL